jgi:hypothetical protein
MTHFTLETSHEQSDGASVTGPAFDTIAALHGDPQESMRRQAVRFDPSTIDPQASLLDKSDLDSLFRLHEVVRIAVESQGHQPAEQRPLLARVLEALQSVGGARRPPPSSATLLSQSTTHPTNSGAAFASFSDWVAEKILVRSHRADVAKLRGRDALNVLEALQTVRLHDTRATSSTDATASHSG